MKLSLSVRIAEGFLSKEEAILSLEQVADLALAAGYDAICMRASQIGVQSSADEVAHAVKILQNHQLDVSMVTPDFAIVYNNEHGPDCLRNITPYLEVAEQFDAPLIRVAIKTEDDIPWAECRRSSGRTRHQPGTPMSHVESFRDSRQYRTNLKSD